MSAVRRLFVDGDISSDRSRDVNENDSHEDEEAEWGRGVLNVWRARLTE